MPRNYKKEYADYHGTPEQVKRRSSRNKARRKVKAPKGLEVEHKDGNANNNSSGNLKLVSAKFQRKQGGAKSKPTPYKSRKKKK